MALDGTTAPTEGRTLAEERERNELLEQRVGTDRRSPALRYVIGVILLIAVFVIAALLIGRGCTTTDNKRSDERSPKTVSSESDRGVGYVSGSWGEVKQTLQNPEVKARWDAMNVAMAEYRGFIIPDEAIDDHLVSEVSVGSPEQYVWTADRRLTGWLNTNWDQLPPRIFGDSFEIGDQFLVMELDILAKYGVDVSKIPAKALVTLPDGTTCVIVTRAICTNHVWPGVSLQIRVQYCDQMCHRENGKLPMYSGPLQTPHDPNNLYTQDDPSYDITEPTADYKPGNAERVEADRGLGDDATGEEGTGSGESTLGGSTTIGTVTIVESGEDPGGVMVDGDSGAAVEPALDDSDPVEWGND